MGPYRVSELARLCGVSPRTIDFYTNQGLLVPLKRSGGGHRLYDEEATLRVRAIKMLRAEGLSLEAARTYLASSEGASDVLPRAGHVCEALRRLEQEVSGLRTRFAELEPGSAARGAAERAVQAALLSTLGLASELANALTGA